MMALALLDDICSAALPKDTHFGLREKVLVGWRHWDQRHGATIGGSIDDHSSVVKIADNRVAKVNKSQICEGDKLKSVGVCAASN